MKSLKSLSLLLAVASGFFIPCSADALILDGILGNDRRNDRNVTVHRPSVGVSVRSRPNYYYDDSPYYYDDRPRYSSRRVYYENYEPVQRRVYVQRSSLEADVQRALAKRGYYRGPIDGQIGAGSRAAIRRYQAARRLPVTGAIDRYLVRSLGL